ncbi:MAG: hypothetical protein EBR86_04575 [Planctomycetia bacterium]|nr:hypothetical protein [Planctomycetia bacterium]
MGRVTVRGLTVVEAEGLGGHVGSRQSRPVMPEEQPLRGDQTTAVPATGERRDSLVHGKGSHGS